MSQPNKNIVLMCDGTWNSPHSRTNVFVLFKELLEEDYKQHVLYMDGVGIGELPLSFIIDGTIALSLDEKVKEAYKFIVSNYNPGDDIWLLGFSRGAYTARCVVGMINNCGILKLDRNISSDQIDKRVDSAYDIYRSRDLVYHPDGQGSEKFKKDSSFPDSNKPLIKFLGLWDTVGAHGLPAYVIGKGFEYLELHDQKIPNIVSFACQALATHERLSFFEPCRILPNESSTVTLKETWFPGVHMEVGGGNFLSIQGNERISKATILWMIEHIMEVGGLLMRNDIKTYRNRYSPDVGPSWSPKTIIFDKSSVLIPTLMIRDRVIPLELDNKDQRVLSKDLLYRDGDWLLPFGDRNVLDKQYPSDTYEELRITMEVKGIRLYNNVTYDKKLKNFQWLVYNWILFFKDLYGFIYRRIEH